MRKMDREKNGMNFPSLYYPELYLLEGGYKKFYEACPVREFTFHTLTFSPSLCYRTYVNLCHIKQCMMNVIKMNYVISLNAQSPGQVVETIPQLTVVYYVTVTLFMTLRRCTLVTAGLKLPWQLTKNIPPHLFR